MNMYVGALQSFDSLYYKQVIEGRLKQPFCELMGLFSFI